MTSLLGRVYSPKGAYTDAGSGLTDEALTVKSSSERLSRSWIIIREQLTLEEAGARLSDRDVEMLHSAHHHDPFSVLGPHALGENTRRFVVRVWIKDADRVQLRFINLDTGNNTWYDLTEHSAWLYCGVFAWEYKCTESETEAESELQPIKSTDTQSSKTNDILRVTPVQYELKVKYAGDDSGKTYIVHDAYRFPCVLEPGPLQRFQSGSCWHVDNLMGGHFVTVDGVEGCRFAVWAPNAAYVSVVGDFNQWDGRAHPMRKQFEFGVWELFIPTTPAPGHKYMYKIHTRSGADVIKIDPFAQEFENPPAHASVLSDDDDAYKPCEARYQWGDQQWMTRRRERSAEVLRCPMAIYEVHLPSWMRGDNNSYLSYRELAHRLVAHCKLMNFTHVEFLPLAHHPFEGSWGYQVTGLYAPYSRLGKPDDLKYLIDQLHQHDIGVYLDFVPAHFVKDDWALSRYDGEPVFEYSDPREGENKTWGTAVFNFRRNEVRSFLLGAAYHWLRRYHIDGLRIDAVSSMLYKNYCRDDWIPNEEGGDANFQAISLLQELNWVVHHEFPGVVTMAEESTSWRGVTDKEKGLGFDCKWDLGWMNDTLAYLCKPTPLRPDAHGKLTFRGLYVSHEKWVLPLSHDEVVSGKGSLLDKCAFKGATFEERISTLKALIAYQCTLSGRPLLFQGCEFGQGREWSESRSVDWHESKEPLRAKLMLCVSEIMQLYTTEPALHCGDDEPWNFKWVDCDNPAASVMGYIRSWEEWFNDILVVCNLGSQTHHRYPLGVPHGGDWLVLLNTDDWAYGGQMNGLGRGLTSKTTQGGRLGWPYCLWLDLPAWSCIILKAPKPDRKTELAERIRIAKAAMRPFELMQRELDELELAFKARAVSPPSRIATSSQGSKRVIRANSDPDTSDPTAEHTCELTLSKATDQPVRATSTAPVVESESHKGS